uniref:Fibrinogen C-terminal domain-containing protein n=1 Tax=Amphimedon queenslandica TaxID=400682 RepID=A0A1X7STI1_AMPQE
MSKMFIFMLLLLCLIVTIDEGEGSYCMADCTGYKHKPSLYKRTCYNSSNLGQTICMREGKVKTIVVCPNVRPQACPPDNRDCKSLFEDGNIISGVYTVNPDGGTPFEVYCDMETDGVTVVDGLYFRGDKISWIC